MKKFLPILLLLGLGSSAYAGGIVTKHTSSVQLTVDAARTDASRIGSSFTISGSNISYFTLTVDKAPKLQVDF